ncbi:MAG: hypothetical protein ACLUGG_12410 [Oscillospiraceae bacterium]
MKYVLRSSPFSDAAHERAWLIRVTINACKDLRKSFFRSRTLPLEAIGEQAADIPPDHREVLEAVLSLPQKYRDVIYLHYYEDYTAPPNQQNFREEYQYRLYPFNPFQSPAQGKTGR